MERQKYFRKPHRVIALPKNDGIVLESKHRTDFAHTNAFRFKKAAPATSQDREKRVHAKGIIPKRKRAATAATPITTTRASNKDEENQAAATTNERLQTDTDTDPLTLGSHSKHTDIAIQLPTPIKLSKADLSPAVVGGRLLLPSSSLDTPADHATLTAQTLALPNATDSTASLDACSLATDQCDACPYCEDVCTNIQCANCQIKRKTRRRDGLWRRDVFTPCEVKRHNSLFNCWFHAHGWVYNASYFMEKHPGGLQCLLRKAGKDVTKDFDFHTKWAKDVIWKSLCIGRLKKCKGSPEYSPGFSFCLIM